MYGGVGEYSNVRPYRGGQSEMGFLVYIGAQQSKYKKQEDSGSKEGMTDSGQDGGAQCFPLNTTTTTTYLCFWGGECRLFPPPSLFGFFLCLSNQLLDEAPGDDGEQGRWGGWRGALILLSNLCVERVGSEPAWLGPPPDSLGHCLGLA